MEYRESIDWLFGTQMFGIKLGLEGTTRLLREALAYPEWGVQVIHVAGTNGKGSTCAMIDAVARASGRRCGLFTSPHLIDFRERIQVGGEMITEDACAAMLTRLREICELMPTPPTFFEIALVLAMQWFRETRCELIVLETGMGGRLDATTAVPADVCVITPVGLDHMAYLGGSLREIAAEKAGIFLAGRPAISAMQDPVVQQVLEQEANAIQAPLEFITEPLRGYAMALAGEHQQWNAALAVAALFKARVPLHPDSVRYGLAHVQWPGRFERLEPRLVVDGAHNPHAASVLAATWQREFPGQPAALIFSAVADKDVGGILAILAPLAARIFLCPVATPRALSADELSAALPAGAAEHEWHDTFPAALAAARQTGLPILVAGSLFLIGEARAHLSGKTFQASMQ